MSQTPDLKKICQLLRYDIIAATSAAGSGHPTSCLSAVELMATLFFGGFLRTDFNDPKNLENDRVIFSKGHAAPLLYSLYHAAGAISYSQLLTLRKFDSPLEGHPSPHFSYVEVATGSLGQGLSVGVGMALGIKLKTKNLKLKISYEPRVWVLLGDSEMAEGQVWEAMEIASYYNLNNLVGILDVNRLGQSTRTMLQWDLATYQKRVESFGWKTVVVQDGHDLEEIYRAFQKLDNSRPTMIIAKTIKGKGVSFLEDKEGWHGKPIPKDKLQQTLAEIGEVDKNLVEKAKIPVSNNLRDAHPDLIGGVPSPELRNAASSFQYKPGEKIATRQAYGDALVALGKIDKRIVALDGEVSNSTFSEKFKHQFPDRFFEMYIAEQNMISTALGLSKMGYIPFVSTFAAFLTRAFDQIRMAQYSNANLKIAGSHVGVSIGQDGPSQMGLEDLAMMRSIEKSVVFYPSDASSTRKLCQLMVKNEGIFYIRLTRAESPIVYVDTEEFQIGGSKILRQSEKDEAVVFCAGVTVPQALTAADQLKKDGLSIAVVDLYCVKPIDEKTVVTRAQKAKKVIVVEDHFQSGGLGEAVSFSLLRNHVPVDRFEHLAVSKIPLSGTTEELLRYEEIDASAIVSCVKKIAS